MNTLAPSLLALSLMTLSGGLAAADADAGRAKAAQVCAACHDANGISVGDAIPNLAGQKPRYLESQLAALKDGRRKHEVMNAIAAQLTPAEIANLAAHYSAQPGAASTTARSELLPNLVKTGVAFPEGYQNTYTKYHAVNFPATRQVRHYLANPTALQAAKAGQPLPDGSVLFVEVYSARLDADQKPVMGADGFYVPDKLLFYTAMAREAGWGRDIPEMLRNADWNYAVFSTDKKHRAGVNQAECLACHKPLDKTSYLFTLKQLGDVARSRY